MVLGLPPQKKTSVSSANDHETIACFNDHVEWMDEHFEKIEMLYFAIGRNYDTWNISQLYI